MQTFMPYPDFAKSAAALDNRRLNKQLVETYQLVLGLLRVNPDGSPKTGRTWADHPMGRLWEGHLASLRRYQRACHAELITRPKMNGGFWASTCLEKTEAILDSQVSAVEDWMVWHPSWFGDEAFHRAHQSNLLRKADEYFAYHTDDGPNGHLFTGPPKSRVRRIRCTEAGGCRPTRMYEWYVPQFGDIPHDLPYLWPAA